MGEGKRYQASFTIEAAWIMAIVLTVCATVIRESGRMHDETKTAMLLHETVEKGRHEKGEELEELSEELEESVGLLLRFSSWDQSVREKNGRFTAEGEGGGWRYVIEMRRFRPESFLRSVTLLEELREDHEN